MIILGAGLWNDVIVVVLANTCSEFLCPNKGIIDAEGKCTNDPNQGFEFQLEFEVGKLFIYITLKSLLIGITFGILSGLLTKYCRFLDKSPIHETFLIFMISLLSYFVAEEFEASGVTSLIACAILQAQYAWYNLSP